MTANKKKALGRGLSAILESPDTDITSKDISGNYVVGAVAKLRLNSIEANPFQPRDHFEDNALNELAASIKEQGIIQPITVRKLGYDKYQLISGERRLRASILAGLIEVPAYIRVANDQQMLEMALVENIQRENLNAIEVSISYQRLMEECSLTQEKLSERVGKNRSTVTNYLRLLKLAPEVQIAIRDNQISMGHARALLAVDDFEKQLALTHQIIAENLSVREVEKAVKAQNQPADAKPKKSPNVLPERYKIRQKALSDQFNTKIEVKRNTKGKGNIVISFKSDDELERLFELLNK